MLHSTQTVIVTVSNDLVTDRRVDNTCRTLHDMGFEVLLVGRRKTDSLYLMPRAYETHRLRLLFEKGFFFYAEFNLRLFFFLLFHKAHVLVSNDLDTLLPCFLVSRLRRIPLVYDTHEFFTGVPELVHRPVVRKVWERIERMIFPRLTDIITVNNGIAGLYKELYSKEITVVRNVPFYKEWKKEKKRPELGLPENKYIILLQGAWINIERGGEEAVEAMRYVPNAVLLIIGGGDAIGKLKQLTQQFGIQDRVIFLPRMPFDKLYEYTVNADIGLTLDKDTNLNYRYSLPNKLFDYIMAGVPVLASPLPEIKAIIDEYKVGRCIENHHPEHIAGCLNSMLSDTSALQKYHENCLLAAKTLCFENERKKLVMIFEKYL